MPEYLRDDLTRSNYKGLCLQQIKEAMDVFPVLLDKLKPRKIIEIGTGHGGLTLFLRNISKPIEFYSFDICEELSKFQQVLIDEGVKINYLNIFKEQVKDWNCLEVKDEWVSIFDETPKLVLCDGGTKKGEFNGLSKYLKPGDVIMLHDYSTSEESFNTLKVWNWFEVQYSDIKDSCEKYNLQPFMHEEFLNVAWGCFIKK